jgi:hypothetical protein
MHDELKRKRQRRRFAPDVSMDDPMSFPPRAKRISSHPLNSSFIILH